jgi:SpoIID/LytB domain protein
MPRVRVGLLQGRESISLTNSSFNGGSGKVIWKVEGKKLAEGRAGTKWRVENSVVGGFKLYKNGNQIRRDGSGVFGDVDSDLNLIFERFGTLVDVGDKSYNYVHGRMQIGTYPTESCGPNFCLRLVVQLPMQKYLFGLAEVPSSWPASVLRTQAIAGRTYAFEKWTRSGSHRYPCDCTVYDSTLDQAYAGDGKRSGSGEYWDEWQAAVIETDGQVITHNGSPIQALYSSSSGGHTEHNEHVWGGSPLPYLRGVRDVADDVSVNPNHSWEPTEMTFRRFSDKVEAQYPSIGDLRDVRIVKRGVSGRVSALDGGGLRLIGSARTVQTSGWEFRSKFGSSILLDTLFYIRIQEAVGERFSALYEQLDGAPGEPTGSPYLVPRGANESLGRAQNFDRGRMTWRQETDRTVWQWGEVLDKYDRVGREASKLGMPTSGIWGKAGSYRGGSYVNGVIFWSEATGAHHIRNGFYLTFKLVEGKKRMGLPTTDVKATPKSGNIQRFTTGTLYQPPGKKTVFALWGEIDERYRKIGMGTSTCGFPTGSMVVDASGAAAPFERGSITFSKSAGVQVHCA